MTISEEVIDPVNVIGERATFVNEKYGPHERNLFDIWLAKSGKPTPLVIYIHGGGFVGGDKSKYYLSQDWPRFLENGISIATINYRFMNEAPYGILSSMNDAKRCLQYIRFHAKKYNIDKTRIACTGADGLLPAHHAHAGRDTRHSHHLDTAGHPALRSTYWRR